MCHAGILLILATDKIRVVDARNVLILLNLIIKLKIFHGEILVLVSDKTKKNHAGILLILVTHKRRVLHAGILLILFSDKTRVCYAGISLIKITAKIR